MIWKCKIIFIQLNDKCQLSYQGGVVKLTSHIHRKCMTKLRWFKTYQQILAGLWKHKLMSSKLPTIEYDLILQFDSTNLNLVSIIFLSSNFHPSNFFLAFSRKRWWEKTRNKGRPVTLWIGLGLTNSSKIKKEIDKLILKQRKQMTWHANEITCSVSKKGKTNEMIIHSLFLIMFSQKK